jgi:hypothetical protein
MNTPTSITFGSPYSFPTFTDYDQIMDIVKTLEVAISSFNVSKHNSIEFATDLFDLKINGQSLEDCLLNATNDYGVLSSLLHDIQKCIGGNTSTYRNTLSMTQEIATQNYLELPYKHPYTQGGAWIPLAGNPSYVRSYADVCNHNSRYFKNGITNTLEFTKKAELVYEHIEFHCDLAKTLDTIRLGNFSDYFDIFSHALNTLNQAYHAISNNPAANEDDLVVIREVSGRLGRTLDCTREAKKKHTFNFPKNDNSHENEPINCEYHLKLNFDDKGNRLSGKYYNRAYFSLKSYPTEERKKIKLAHLGAHL